MADLDTGVLYCSDNLERLATLPSGSVDLIYLDPPFFSNRIYEVIWGDEAEVRSFEDRWEGGIQVYINWMRDRMVQLHRVLKPTGSLYLHCDPHASHYLKVMVDAIFGAENFVNEVIWQRTASKGDAVRKFGAVHDVLLVYARTARYTFQPIHVAKDDAYLERFRLDDDDGRGPYRLAPLDSPNPRPNLTYEYKGFQPPAKGWRVTRELMEQLDAAGRLAFPRLPGGRIARKHYLSEQAGRKASDVWTDMPPLQAASAERLGYPTQKPETLLERIITASSNPGDVVLDPFCGCGTTVRVADRIGRRYVGIDISPTAMRIMRNRLMPARVRPTIIGLPTTADDLRALKPFEFQNWVVEQYFGTHHPRKSGDMGIDGYTFLTAEPIQVKQSDHVGRNVIDNFETAMRRGGHTRGYVVGFSFTRGAHEEVARALWEDGQQIELVTVEKLAKSQPKDRFPLAKEGKLIKLPEAPPARPREALPTAEELVASDRRAS